MKSFFNAKKIAVIGASRDKNKVGNVVFRKLLESGLKIFPVNPSTEQILGQKSFPDVLSIPFPVDMAIIIIPSKLVPQVLEQCGKKKIKNVIIISAGFSESGKQGEKLEIKVKEIAENYKIRILGPNVLGILNPYKNLNASFFNELPRKGNIGIISQSGAVGTSLLDKSLQLNLGISGFVSLGNQSDIDFISTLEYFGDDRNTEVIIIYIESLKPEKGQKFVELAKKISKKKKIIAIKSGKTEQGRKAAKTHTSSLSSSAKIYSGIFKQSGIIETNSLTEMLMLARIISKYKKLGKKAGIITNAGGLGVLSVDYCTKAGIELPAIPEKTLTYLDNFLPKGNSRTNPLDILGDALADRYEKTLRILSSSNLFDFFIIIISPQEMTQPLETAKIIASRGKPIFSCFQGGKSFIKAKRFLEEHNIIYFSDISSVKLLGKAIEK